MDITGVFIRITNKEQSVYLYLLYQRRFEEMIANKDELNARLRQMWSAGSIDVSYYDIGKPFEKIIQNVPTSDMLFSATDSHVILKSKHDLLVYEKLHENPFCIPIKEIHHRLHDRFAQHQTVSLLSNARDKETFFKTLTSLTR